MRGGAAPARGAVFAAACGSAGAAPRHPAHAANVTLYHVLQHNYTGITNMNSGDPMGDAEFMLRAAGLPYLCSPESGVANYTFDCFGTQEAAPGLVVDKVVVEADTRFSDYAECNVHAGVYSCECRNHSAQGHHHSSVPCNATIGRMNLINESGWAHEMPNTSDPNPRYNTPYRYIFYNMAQKLPGMWYSTLGKGECGNPEANGTCAWRVAQRAKRVTKECQESWIYKVVQDAGQPCFDRCAQPTNRSTACWTWCFYDTVLGPNSNRTSYPAGAGKGMSAQTLTAAWLAGFESDDPAKGGCPDVTPPAA